MIIDTHCHLTDEKFDIDREYLINNFEKNNIKCVITSGSDKNNCKLAFELSQKYENVYCSLGIHPETPFECDEDYFNWLNQVCDNIKVVAIGEIGLDYYYSSDNKNQQIECFIKQLAFANGKSLPVVIHCRDAYEDMLKILKENKNLIKNGGVIHCFSGSLEIAWEFIKLGFKLGIGGVLTFKNTKKTVEVVKNVPINGIIIETDCPWLAPDGHRGERNEPSYTNIVVEKLSELLNLPIVNLENILLENTQNLYKKIK